MRPRIGELEADGSIGSDEEHPDRTDHISATNFSQ
jgi:hypothetical protein